MATMRALSAVMVAITAYRGRLRGDFDVGQARLRTGHGVGGVDDVRLRLALGHRTDLDRVLPHAAEIGFVVAPDVSAAVVERRVRARVVGLVAVGEGARCRE